MSTAVLLGAGFSEPAGYPLARDINERFASFDPNGAIRSLSSSEYGWTDRLGPRDMPQGYNDTLGHWLKKLIGQYLIGRSAFSYEEFHEFIRTTYRDMSPDQKVVLYEQTVTEVKARYPDYFEESIRSGMPLSSLDILDRLNGLIADLLRPGKSKSEVVALYRPFMRWLLASSDPLSFLTLNHDMLVEFLLRAMGVPWSDGFTAQGGLIVGYQDNPIPYFDGTFLDQVELLKLHGSIDMYRFDESEPIDATTSQFTGRTYYIKPKRHEDKLYLRVKGQHRSGVVYSTNPEFVTGVGKPQLIAQSPMYTQLFERSAIKLKESSRLIIIGYGFGDPHINQMLASCLVDEREREVIVVHRSKKVPADLNPKARPVTYYPHMLEVPLV